MYPPYKLIVDFSKEIKPETGLILFAYGINNGLPNNYEYINGAANFKASYALYKKKEDLISLDYARQLPFLINCQTWARPLPREEINPFFFMDASS